MWPFTKKQKQCPHFKRDLSVICDRHIGCRTCKRRIGKWPCKIVAIKGVPTMPDVPYADGFHPTEQRR